MSIAANENAPLKEPVLGQVLDELVALEVILSNLRDELENPLSEEDREAGAVERSPDEIAAELEAASRKVTMILLHLQVDPQVWSDRMMAVE